MKSLYVEKACIGHVGAKALAEAMMSARAPMTTLYIAHNAIGDAGAVALADALATSATMKTLDMGYNHIGDVGAIALAAAIAKSRTLVDLNLECNEFGVHGATALAEAAAKSYSLTALDIRSARLPELARMNAIDAVSRAVEYRRVLAFVGAVVPGRERSRTPAEAFVWGDGDTALAHRIAKFLG
jgi:Ran GTPase-activating protein (RanGAP) involved in mRNA processing and transport